MFCFSYTDITQHLTNTMNYTGKGYFTFFTIVNFIIIAVVLTIITRTIWIRYIDDQADSSITFYVFALTITTIILFLHAYFSYYKFKISNEDIRVNYPLSGKTKQIKLADIGHVRFSDMSSPSNPLGGVLTVYNQNNKPFISLVFHDSNTWNKSDIVRVAQYFYNLGIEVELGKTQKEFRYYITLFRNNAG